MYFVIESNAKVNEKGENGAAPLFMSTEKTHDDAYTVLLKNTKVRKWCNISIPRSNESSYTVVLENNVNVKLKRGRLCNTTIHGKTEGSSWSKYSATWKKHKCKQKMRKIAQHHYSW